MKLTLIFLMCKLIQTSLIALHLHLLTLHGLSPFYCGHLCVSDSFDSLFRVRENVLAISVCVCMHVLSHFGCVRLFVNQCTVACQAPLSMDFPGKNTGVVCHFLLQGFFPTQGSDPYLLCLLHWQVDSLPLSHLGSPCQTLLWS